jgi:hypothetical protein
MAALWFVLLALVVVAGVALAASTRAGQVLTLLICAGVLMLGLLSDPVLGRYVGLYQERSAIAVSDVDTVTFDERAAEEPQRPSNDRLPPPPAARAAGHVGYALVPNFQFFWLGDAVTQQRPVTFGYLLQVTAYALVYLTALLALAVALFQMRDAS